MSVTIGLSFYNAEDYLEDAIKSVFAQTYTDWELILVNDGSKDRSLDIAKSIKDPRIKIISDGKNKKLAFRLNEIVSLAKNDIIVRMDADDLMAPERIEKQVNILKNNPNIDLITTGVVSLTKDLNQIIGARSQNYKHISLYDLLFKTKGIVHASIIGRKSWFLRNMYNPDLKIAQDYELWVRAASKNDLNIIAIPDLLYYYREEINVTYKKMRNAYNNERNLFKQYGDQHKKKLLLKSYIKSSIIYGLEKLGSLNILLTKRNTTISDIQLINKIKKDISIIKNIKLPQ